MSKKVILGIIILVVVVGLSVTLCITVLNNKQSNETIDKSNNIEQQTQNEEVQNSQQFWATTYNFANETKDFNLNLFDGWIKGKTSLEDFENRGYNFTYYAVKNGELKSTEQTVNKISKIVANILPNDTLKVFIQNSNKDYAPISSFIIKNYSDKKITAQEGIKKGWWYVGKESQNTLTKADIGLNDINADFNESEQKLIMSKIADSLGKPSYIYVYMDSEDGSNKNLSYNVIYEYDDYTIDINVFEYINTNSDNYRMVISYLNYYKKEAWDNMKQIYTGKVDLLAK